MFPIAALLMLAVYTPVHSGTFKGGNFIDISEDKVINNDLYLWCRRADVSGMVENDLIVGCQKLNISGTVTQNLYCAAQTVRIDGEVRGDILGFGQDIELNGRAMSGFRGGCGALQVEGEVFGDIVVGASMVTIGPKAVIEGDLYIGSGELVVEGEIRGKVIGGVQNLTLSGIITEDVRLEVESIVIEPTGKIGGDLIYTSEKPIEAEYRSRVIGDIIFEQTDKGHIPWRGFCWVWKIWAFIAALATAFILAAVFRENLRENFEAFSDRPWKSLLIGFLGFIVIPVAGIIALALIITIPLGLILGALYGIFLYLGWVIGGILLGRLALNLLGSAEPSLFLSALSGIVLLSLLSLIPIFGGLVCFISIVAGMSVTLAGIYSAFWGEI